MSNYSEFEKMARALGYDSVEELIKDQDFIIKSAQEWLINHAKMFSASLDDKIIDYLDSTELWRWEDEQC